MLVVVLSRRSAPKRVRPAARVELFEGLMKDIDGAT